MRFLSAHTTTPVPIVYKVWTLPQGGAAFLMQWFDGAHILEESWRTLSESDKTTIAHRMRLIIDDLRTFPQPPALQGRICQFDGGACWNERLKGQDCGPSITEKESYDFRIGLLDIYRWEPNAKSAIDLLDSQLKSDHRIVLTLATWPSTML